MDAIARARDWAQTAHGVSLVLIIDIARDLASPEEAMTTAEWAADAHGEGLVAALGLGGYEVGFPPEMFAKPFALAAEAGVPAVVHAGETGGADSVKNAITELGARRIGHGVRCLEDPAVVALVKERGVTLEVCPTSNLLLGVVSDMAAHPLPRLLAEGLDVTLNTDDPALFDTTLPREYAIAQNALGVAPVDLKALTEHAAHVALLPEPDRARLAHAIAQGWPV